MKKAYSYFLLFIGVLGFVIFIEHLMNFSGHEYFYIQNPNIDKYVGVNVVSRWADFSYFTYHTLIFFSTYCILTFISDTFKLAKLNQFLLRSDVVSFITTNYILTTLCYTIFEVTSANPTFGLYGNAPGAWHSFGTNIVVHYLFFIIAIINYFKIKTNDLFSKKSYVLLALYFVIYFATVKLTGMYAYRIEWYPYPIFDGNSLAQTLGLNPNNKTISLMLLIVADILIFILYLVIYRLMKHFKDLRKKEV